MRQATRRTAWLLAGVTLLWLISLLVTVTRFGEACTVTFEQGFLGLYWGGDPEVRNSRIDNHFSTPWNPGCGAGRSLPEGMTWAAYGPDFDWNRLKDAYEYGTLWTCELGFWCPQARFASGDGYVIAPLWTAVALTLGAFVFRVARSGRVFGRCGSCGYDLTGNVSGRCPECGKPLSSTLNKSGV